MSRMSEGRQEAEPSQVIHVLGAVVAPSAEDVAAGTLGLRPGLLLSTWAHQTGGEIVAGGGEADQTRTKSGWYTVPDTWRATAMSCRSGFKIFSRVITGMRPARPPR